MRDLIGNWPVPRFVFALIFFLVMIPGCDNGPEEKPKEINSEPFAGISVRIAVPKDMGLADQWQILLDEWSAQTGARYEFQEYDATEIVPGLQKLEADLMLVPNTAVSELTANNLLKPISEPLLSPENLNWIDLHQGLRDKIVFSAGQPTIVPISSSVLVCYYRSDLLQDAGLAPPETWSDYARLVDTMETWANGLKVVEPWAPNWRTTTFLAKAAPYVNHWGHFSLYFDFQTGEPLIATDGFQQALTDCMHVIKQMPDDVLNYSPTDCRAQIINGNAALAIALETSPGGNPLPFGPAPSDKKPAEPTRAEVSIGFCRLPGVQQAYNRSTKMWEAPPNTDVNFTTLTAFSGLSAAVSANVDSVTEQAAWNLLAVLAIDNPDSAFPGAIKTAVRSSQTNSAISWVGNGLTPAEAQSYVTAVVKSLNDTRISAELPVVGRKQFRDSLTVALNEVLSGKATPKVALENANARWAEIAEKLGRENVKNSYTKSLRLPGVGR